MSQQAQCLVAKIALMNAWKEYLEDELAYDKWWAAWNYQWDIEHQMPTDKN